MKMTSLAKASVLTAVAVMLTAIAAYIFFVKIPGDLARTVSREFTEAFNFTPQVTVDQTIVVEQNIPIAEIATVARDLLVEYAWSHQWLGSTKSITLRGTFTAKAGFDLREPFQLDIREGRVFARMPAPKILSLQMNSLAILKDDNGWWNRISDTDREAAVHELQQIARDKAQSTGMLAEARSTIEERINEIVKRNGATVEFRYPWQEK